MSHARAQTLLRSLRASLPASSLVGGPTGFTPALSAVRATPARAVPSSRRPLSTNSSPRAPYRRFGDPPRSAPSPHQHQPDSAPSARPVQPADARQVFELLRAATSRGGRGGGRSGFSAGGGGPGGGRPGWHNFQAYLRSPVFLVLVAGGGTYYVLHLEQVPETGRWRFMDVPPDLERQMGAQGLQEVMSEYGGRVLPDWHPQARYVQQVVKRIIRANGLEDKLGGSKEGWKTHVVKDDGTKKCVLLAPLSGACSLHAVLTLAPPLSAFVLPNGSIFVFTGIMKVANDEDSLACVLGHEIAHQVARHSAERMSGMKVFYGLAFLLSSFGIDAGLSQVLLNYVFSLPNSRKNETEADLIGLRLANNACFDPRAAEGLWRRMSAEEGAGPGVDMSFLSTHPSSKNRTRQVREWADEVLRDRPGECAPVRGQVEGFQRASGARWR
ncbi:peptidase family M48-domain-containing protein [Rhodotorula diobovata]|uniref:Peptidase family M48-domain-containing protein n=1 Tax=Rhodotorula diobovata TaxID=5288 RepID=A0A5C5FXZ8_9BASI|nr:peptidase family M48-domain-containing protein [Rhodotorula diobovata]